MLSRGYTGQLPKISNDLVSRKDLLIASALPSIALIFSLTERMVF
jgi:hypothetical protein